MRTIILMAMLSVVAQAQWIQGVSVSTITATSVTVNWASCAPASSSVSYGTTSAYGSTAGSGTLATTHSVPLSSLLPSTTYHFSVSGADSTGAIVTSKDSTFITAAIPPPPTRVTLWPATK